ncbi:MAG: sodium:proton antiporter [Actinobacteria bacterium]|jgi:CPA1 family monovalent cation:H+ antiporter|nr:sodium:proton antiporter [Actinomycetota bacterium]
MFAAVGVLLTATAILAWINDRWIKAPATVGVTMAGAVSALVLIGAHALGIDFGLAGELSGILTRLDLSTFLLQGILSVLLFAGALELDAPEMLRQRWPITVLAVGATLVSTALIGLGAWGVFTVLGLGIPLIWALIFGALISPTDPVAVLDMLKRAKVPKRIETLISGEALFNDGVGIVVFLAVGSFAGLSLGGHPVEGPGAAALLFAQEALGGMLFGAVLGWLGVRMLGTITDPGLEVLVTLTMVIAGYAAALALGVSGPIAMVVAGLVVSARKHEVLAVDTAHQVEGFWSTLDQVLNILLFTFIGLDVLLTPTSAGQVAAGILIIPLALVARWVSVGVPLRTLPMFGSYGPWTTTLLTWGGLRGGIAISLALGLPPGPHRSTLVTATYAVVLFSIIVQGLTVRPVIAKATAAAPA